MTKSLKYFVVLICLSIVFQSLSQKLPIANLYGIYFLEEGTGGNNTMKIDWQIIICRNNKVLIKTLHLANNDVVFLKTDSIPNCFLNEKLEFKMGFNCLMGKYEIQHDTLMLMLNDRQSLMLKIIDSLNLKVINKNFNFLDFRTLYAHKVMAFYQNHWYCGLSGTNNIKWVYNGDTYDTLLINRRNNFWMFADTTKTSIYEQLDAFRIYDTTVYSKYKQ